MFTEGRKEREVLTPTRYLQLLTVAGMQISKYALVPAERPRKGCVRGQRGCEIREVRISRS